MSHLIEQVILYRRGERMSVEGPSGLGKTRLLRAIAQLDKPIGGTMSIIEVRELNKIVLDWIGLDWIRLD